MSKIEERIEQQQKKIQQEKARLQQLQARARGEERRKDTRRKIVAGALVLNAAKASPKLAAFLRQQLMEKASDRDRELFADLLQCQPPPGAPADPSRGE